MYMKEHIVVHCYRSILFIIIIRVCIKSIIVQKKRQATSLFVRIMPLDTSHHNCRSKSIVDTMMTKISKNISFHDNNGWSHSLLNDIMSRYIRVFFSQNYIILWSFQFQIKLWLSTEREKFNDKNCCKPPLN